MNPTKQQIEAAAKSLADTSQASWGKGMHWKYTTDKIRDRWRGRAKLALIAAMKEQNK